DGSTSAGVVSGANGSFTVTGGHTYADEGSFALSTAITRTADNTTITPTGTVTAAEGDALTPHAATITGTAGQALSNVTVATFTDSDTASGAGDFTATIDWGDGTKGAGTVSGSNGTFSVSGSHTYAAAGSDPIVVTLSDDAPGTATATANSTAQIGSGTGTLSGQVTLNSATEATALPTGTTVARFTDTNASDAASGFTATITWGDGSTSAGVVSGANGSFTVTGGHTYADEGSFALSTAITRTADNTTITPTGTVTAAEGDALTPHAATITGTAGQALSNVTVATFTDSDTASGAGDFTATIDWGDGTKGTGTVSGSNGTFSVSGSHTYAAAGSDPIVVTLSDDAPGTATATANSTAQIGGGGGGGGRTISSSTTGPFSLTATDIPLTITGSGTVTSTGSGVDGIDGPSNRAATITNAGKVTSSGGVGISLTDGGALTNAAGGFIAGLTSGIYGAYGPTSTVTNAGSITATGSNGAGVYLSGGGGITNQTGGSISGAYIGITILRGSGRVTNSGRILNGVYLAGGGSLTNSAGASTSGNNFGVFIGVGPGTVSNGGSISSTSNNGVYLQAGGSVTNSNGGSISGPGFGVAVYGGSGTVTNNGTISGYDAVMFANSGSDRLVVGPNAVFKGSVIGGSGSNTLELAGGKGSIAGLSGGSGTVTENGSWSFTNFGTLGRRVLGHRSGQHRGVPAQRQRQARHRGGDREQHADGVPGQQRAVDRQPAGVRPERRHGILCGSTVAGLWRGRQHRPEAVRPDGSGRAIRSDNRAPAGHERRLAAREPVVSGIKPGRRDVPYRVGRRGWRASHAELTAAPSSADPVDDLRLDAVPDRPL
ncbi:MAG: hypothetical protein J0H14_02450, partial [Alphaproteobacteria bacterium]|nr:hypothetical protein [Alphaproteobacteria bacterium]